MIAVWRETSPDKMIAFLKANPWPNETFQESQSYVNTVVADQRNHLVVSDWGAIVFISLGVGMYECHTVVHPDAPKVTYQFGLKSWAFALAQAAVHYLFTRTDALELRTQILATNNPAMMLAQRAGMRREFFLDEKNTYVFSLSIVEWAATAPELIERGLWYHERLAKIAAEQGFPVPHEADWEPESHNRYVGAAVCMAQAGQLEKAVRFYNDRWSRIVEDPFIEFLGGNRILVPGVGILTITADDFSVQTPLPAYP